MVHLNLNNEGIQAEGSREACLPDTSLGISKSWSVLPLLNLE